MVRTPIDAALRLLDEVQDQRQLDAFAAESFLGLVREATMDGGVESIAGLASRVDGLHGVLDAIDRFAQKELRIRLAHVLADLPVAPQFRTYLAAQGTSYAGDLGLLRGRVREAIARVSPQNADGAAADVVAVAERSITRRTMLRDGVLAIVRQFATVQLDTVRRVARDRALSDSEGRGWRVAALELQLVAETPARIEQGGFAERTRSLPVPDEEVPSETPPSDVGSLLEID